MLQHLGAGQAAILGDVANQKQNRAGLLGKAGQVSGAFPDL